MFRPTPGSPWCSLGAFARGPGSGLPLVGRRSDPGPASDADPAPRRLFPPPRSSGCPSPWSPCRGAASLLPTSLAGVPQWVCTSLSRWRVAGWSIRMLRSRSASVRPAGRPRSALSGVPAGSPSRPYLRRARAPSSSGRPPRWLHVAQDIKDMRFGMGLSSMRVPCPDRRDHLLLISALAIAVLSLLGPAGERIGYDRWLRRTL